MPRFVGPITAYRNAPIHFIASFITAPIVVVMIAIPVFTFWL